MVRRRVEHRALAVPEGLGLVPAPWSARVRLWRRPDLWADCNLEGQMSKRQIVVLFLCNLMPWWFGAGATPLLPVYVTRLGADPAVVGGYLAVAFAGIAAGAASASGVARLFRSHKIPMILAGCLSLPLAWAMGQVSSVGVLTVLTALMWYWSGVGTSLVGIVAGLGAGPGERGRVFGILGMASSVGAMVGGLSMGAIVDRWGFTTLFSVAAGVLVLWPLFGLLVADVKRAPSTPLLTGRTPLPAGRTPLLTGRTPLPTGRSAPYSAPASISTWWQRCCRRRPASSLSSCGRSS